MAKLAINGGSPVRTRPLPTYPTYGEEEIQAAARVIRRGTLCSAMNPPGEGECFHFEREFADYIGTKFAIATSNGTTALHTALAAAGIGVGDEVIVPPYTFLSTATSVVMANAIPIFADIEPETLGLDPQSVRQRITPRTKAMIVVHMNGFPADMDGLMQVAEEHNLIVIEDCSHAHGAEYHSQKVGSLGHMAAFSFQQKKNLSVGEGGIVTTNHEKMAEIADKFRTLGDLPLAFNYRITELHAAIGRVRLRRLDEENSQRRANGAYLDQHLSDLPGISPVKARENTNGVYYNYVAVYDEEQLGVSHAKLLEAINAEGIPVQSFYFPLQRQATFQAGDAYGRGCPFACPFYLQSAGQPPEYNEADCPVAVEYCDHRILDFKIHPLSTIQDMTDIATAFSKVTSHIDQLR